MGKVIKGDFILEKTLHVKWFRLWWENKLSEPVTVQQLKLYETIHGEH